MKSNANIKTLVISVVRPYMTGLKMYYSELYNKVLIKLDQHDNDLISHGQATLTIEARLADIDEKYLQHSDRLHAYAARLDSIEAVLSNAGFEGFDGEDYADRLLAIEGRLDEIEKRISSPIIGEPFEDPEPNTPEAAPDPEVEDKPTIDETLNPSEE